MHGRADLRQGDVQDKHGGAAIRALLCSPVGGMTLLQLSRQPHARTAVHTYARIARHLSGTHATLDGWMGRVQMPIRDVEGSIGQGNGLLTEVAWKETIAELAFLYGTGRL